MSSTTSDVHSTDLPSTVAEAPTTVPRASATALWKNVVENGISGARKRTTVDYRALNGGEDEGGDVAGAERDDDEHDVISPDIQQILEGLKSTPSHNGAATRAKATSMIWQELIVKNPNHADSKPSKQSGLCRLRHEKVGESVHFYNFHTNAGNKKSHFKSMHPVLFKTISQCVEERWTEDAIMQQLAFLDMLEFDAHGKKISSQIHMRNSSTNPLDSFQVLMERGRSVGKRKRVERFGEHDDIDALDYFVAMCMSTGIGINLANNTYLQALVGSRKMSRALARDRLPVLHDAIKTYINNAVGAEPFIAITSDAWTDSRNRSYVALTYHAVTDALKLISLTGDARPVPARHTSVELANVIEECFCTAMSAEALVSGITTDTGANIRKAVHLILSGDAVETGAVADLDDSNSADEDEPPAGAVDENVTGWKCVAHVLQLCFTDLFGSTSRALKVFKADIGTVRAFVVKVRGSKTLRALLTRAQKPEQALELIQDVATRWSSTHAMLERFVLLFTSGAIPSFLRITGVRQQLDSSNIPTPEIYGRVCSYVLVLEPIANATRNLEGSRYTSISKVPRMVNELIDVLSSSESAYEEAIDVQGVLLASVQKRLGWVVARNNAALQAALFDPLESDLDFLSPDLRAQVWSSLEAEGCRTADVMVKMKIWPPFAVETPSVREIVVGNPFEPAPASAMINDSHHGRAANGERQLRAKMRETLSLYYNKVNGTVGRSASQKARDELKPTFADDDPRATLALRVGGGSMLIDYRHSGVSVDDLDPLKLLRCDLSEWKQERKLLLPLLRLLLSVQATSASSERVFSGGALIEEANMSVEEVERRMVSHAFCSLPEEALGFTSRVQRLSHVLHAYEGYKRTTAGESSSAL